ncbi:MAG TPA: AMP-binding protein [Candidatus Binatia bacterium]
MNAPDWRSSNAADAILAARAHDERPALIDLMRTGADATSNAGVAVSYARLVELVEAATRELRALGLARDGGEVPRVCLAGANGTTYVVLALAVLRAGACLVPLASELSHAEREQLVRAVHPRAVLLAPGARWEGSVAPQRVLRVGGDEVGVVLAPCGDARSPLDEARLAALDPAFIRFSSGTTGASKGVVLSHRTLLERVAAANRGLGITADDRVLWVLSMAHHFAASILLYLANGATTVLVGAQLPAELLGAAREHAATVLYASPFHYGSLAAVRAEGAWPSLRLAVSTAASLPTTTARAFEARFGVPPAQALGIIEVGIVALNRTPRERPESIGRPLPDFAVELRDERGAVVAPGEIGELFVRGPGMLDAYLWPFRSRDEILQDGWFSTGDLATAAADGSLTLVGRARSVINVSGLKCFPEEIEAVLERHPEVAAARVSGRPHAHVGAVPVADVVPRDPQRPPEPRELAAHCRASLARFKVPVEFRFVDELPRTASGKVKR